MVIVGGLCRILKLKSLVADMPDIAVAAIAVVGLEGKIDVMSRAIFQLLLTGLDIPGSPGSNDLHLGSQRLDAQLETNLIVSFSGSAMADGNSALLFGDIHKDLCNQRAGHCSAEKVFVLVGSVCFYAGSNVFVTKFVSHVLNI